MEQKIHKIAIVKYNTAGSYNDYDDYNEIKILESITDWEKVDEETFDLLKQASHKMGFTVLEQPSDIKQFITKTIADYKKVVKDEKDKMEKLRKENEAKALEKRLKKEAKTVAQKKALFNKLREEFGE